MEAKAGHTYRVFFEGKEEEHFIVQRTKGRRIYFGVTAWSALNYQTTRTRWRKLVAHIQDAGGSITEEPTLPANSENHEVLKS